MFMYVYMYVCTCIHTYTCICVYICVYVYMYTHTYSGAPLPVLGGHVRAVCEQLGHDVTVVTVDGIVQGRVPAGQHGAGPACTRWPGMYGVRAWGPLPVSQRARLRVPCDWTFTSARAPMRLRTVRRSPWIAAQCNAVPPSLCRRRFGEGGPERVPK